MVQYDNNYNEGMHLKKSKRFDEHIELISSGLKNKRPYIDMWKEISGLLPEKEKIDYNTFYVYCKRRFDENGELLIKEDEMSRGPSKKEFYVSHREFILQAAKRHGRRGAKKTYDELTVAFPEEKIDYQTFMTYVRKDKELSEILHLITARRTDLPTGAKDHLKKEEPKALAVEDEQRLIREFSNEIALAGFEKINRINSAVMALSNVNKEFMSDAIMRMKSRDTVERAKVLKRYLEYVEDINKQFELKTIGDVPMMSPWSVLFLTMQSMAINPHYFILILAMYGDAVGAEMSGFGDDIAGSQDEQEKARKSAMEEKLESAQDAFLGAVEGVILSPMDLNEFMKAMENADPNLI